MKNLPTIIIVILLALILFTAMRKEPKIDDIDLNDGLSEINVPQIGKLKKKIHLIDFSACKTDESFKIDTGLSIAQLKVVGPEEDNCLVETTYELKGGYYVNECFVPSSLGTIEFSEENFESISKYCKIKSTGSGLLELGDN